MLRRQSSLLLGIMLAIILLVLAAAGVHPPVVQEILALPFVLVVPGNALSRAIFPTSSLNRLERFLLVIGLSLGVLILSGLVLNLTPWGLQADSWLVMLSAITLVASVIAIFRQSPMPVKKSTSMRNYLPLRQVMLLGLAIVSVGFALKITFTPQPPDNISGYTSLWILPESAKQPGMLLVGIHSQEFKTTRYILQAIYNGQLLQEWPNISLAPGEQNLLSITLPAKPGLLEANLYRADNPGVVYRHVSITLSK